MEDSPEKKSLRSLLLEKRDNTSFDFMKIVSEKIQKRLKKINAFRNAQKIGRRASSARYSRRKKPPLPPRPSES